MKAAEARTYSEQVLGDFRGGLSAKAISKKYQMHERHVKMILDEAGIDAMQEYKKRVADGAYSHLLSRKQSDTWYVARFGKTREEAARDKERRQAERREQEERKQLTRSLISVLKATSKEKAKQERAEEKQKMFAPVRAVCKHCGKEWTFYPSAERYGKKKPYTYCSKGCRVAHNKCKESDNIGHRLRKYGMGNAKRDVIRLDELIKRDKGICYLCGCQTTKDDSWLDSNGYHVCGSKYPTIDHVIPLSKGGRHVWSNVKLACRNCNSHKEARIIS